MNKQWFLITVISTMLVFSVVGCGSAGGNPPAQNTQVPPNAGNPPAFSQNGGPGGRGGPGVQGTVTSVNGNAIQLAAQDGSTLTVNTNDQTNFQKRVTGTRADLQVNTMVFVTGTENNGTITANTIQITLTGDNAPQGFPGRGPGNGGNFPGGTPPQGGGPNAPKDNFPQGSGPNVPGGSFPQRGGTAGVIQSVNGDTLELNGMTGETVTVQLADSTIIQKTESASLVDIQANTLLTVLGETNGNTVTARLVQIGSVGD